MANVILKVNIILSNFTNFLKRGSFSKKKGKNILPIGVKVNDHFYLFFPFFEKDCVLNPFLARYLLQEEWQSG